MYAKNCDYDGTSECTHMQQIQQIITDFVWLCPQRFVLNRKQFKIRISICRKMLNSVKNQRRQFGVFFDTPYPSYNKAQNSCTNLSCTCSGSLYLFGSKSAKLSETELKFQEQYQNFYGNFIRHGNPNNWTDNPNQSSRFEASGFGEIEQEALKIFS